MYILVLEDDPFLSFDLCDALSEFEIEICGVLKIDEAMALIESNRPALALLDYNIKETTSATVAERLAHEDVPFGYVTADAESVRGDPLVPDCPIVEKPYRAEDIVELVAQLLRR